MAEWIYEKGIGENRAALVEDGRIVEAHVEPYEGGLVVGSVCTAGLKQILVPGKRIVAETGSLLHLGARNEVLIEKIPEGFKPDQVFQVEITREAMFDGRKWKRAKGRIAWPGGNPLESGVPQLLLINRLKASENPVREVNPHDPDLLEDYGWFAVIDAAEAGEVSFPGGSLSVTPTPAMTLIDVDGWLDPEPLALAAAKAVAETIRLFGLGGSIGVDFPTTQGRLARARVTECVVAHLPRPFEFTGVNGYGFMQIIRPRPRASLVEKLREKPATRAVCSLLRRAQRSGLIGATTLVVNPEMAHILNQGNLPLPPGWDEFMSHNGLWMEQLSRHLGGPVSLQIEPGLSMESAYVTKTS